MKRFFLSSTIGASLLGLLAIRHWRAALAKRVIDGAAGLLLTMAGRLVRFDDGRMYAYQDEQLNLSISPKRGESPIVQTVVFNGLDSLLTTLIWRGDALPPDQPNNDSSPTPPEPPDTPPDDPTGDPPGHDGDFWRGKLG